MKKSVICYMCAWCRQCDKENEKKCTEMNYALFATEQEKEMCDLMCGEVEEDENELG